MRVVVQHDPYDPELHVEYVERHGLVTIWHPTSCKVDLDPVGEDDDFYAVWLPTSMLRPE